MKRRTFLRIIGAAAAAVVLPASSKACRGPSMFEPAWDSIRAIAIRKSPAGMKHLYDNGEGELVAANSMEEAAHHLDVEMGGCDAAEAARRLKDYFEIEDGAIVPIIDSENGREVATKMTAKEWAAQYAEPIEVASTYW